MDMSQLPAGVQMLTKAEAERMAQEPGNHLYQYQNEDGTEAEAKLNVAELDIPDIPLEKQAAILTELWELNNARPKEGAWTDAEFRLFVTSQPAFKTLQKHRKRVFEGLTTLGCERTALDFCLHAIENLLMFKDGTNTEDDTNVKVFTRMGEIVKAENPDAVMADPISSAASPTSSSLTAGARGLTTTASLSESSAGPSTHVGEPANNLLSPANHPEAVHPALAPKLQPKLQPKFAPPAKKAKGIPPPSSLLQQKKKPAAAVSPLSSSAVIRPPQPNQAPTRRK